MISSIVLFTTLATLAAHSVDALTVQSIQQGSSCLRVGNNPTSGSSITAGSAVTLGECNNNNPLSATFTGQQWIITRGNNDGVTLYGTGLCLDAGNDTPNQNIVVNTCNGSPSQTWWATEDNRIAITGGNQCLEGEGSQATTGDCAPGIANQAFTYDLLFDTETATALVPGAIGTGVSRGLIPSTASSSIASAINSLENSASSAIASLTSGAVAGASSVVNSAQSAASVATASASSVVAGASSSVASATGVVGGAATSASSAMGSAASSASSGVAGAASSASSGAAGAASSASSGAAGAASSASSGASDATSAAGGLVSSLRSVAATITSGAGAAASSITPGNAAVSDFHLSKVALLFSAVAIGAAMVV